MTEPEKAPTPAQQPQRTPLGDAIFFGTSLLLWTAFMAVLGHLLNLDRVWWTVTTAGVGLFAVVVAWLVHGIKTVEVAAWWAVALAAAFGWLAWARWGNLRTPGPWLGLAAGALVVLSAYPLVMRHVNGHAAAAKLRAADAERKRAENYWPRLLAELGFAGVSVVTKEETRGGLEVLLRLPASGKYTWKQLAQAVDKLEVAADLRHGSLRFEPGQTAREAILTVSTRDILAETISYVDDGQPLSIRNPIPIGRYEDGSVCYVTLREACLLIIGLRGSGKSNLLNVLIAQLVRCVDALILLSDTKYRLAMPWVQPHLDDPAKNGMAVHWVATDRDELEIMLRSLLAGIKARSAAGSGGEKIEPRPEEPALVTIMDEVASVLGEDRGPRPGEGVTTNLALQNITSEAVQIGRSEAAEFVLASQRGTVTMTGGGDMKSQFSTRIGLRTASQADASYVIPDDSYAAQLLASLKHQGSGVVMESRDDRSAPVKFFRITGEQIGAVARRYGPMKPAPEAVLQRVWGQEWAQRWDRFRDTRRQATRAADTDTQFQEITAQLGDVEEATGDSASVARQKMREFMKRSGERGVTVKMICDRLAADDLRVADRTVRRWLDKDIEAGIAERVNHLLVRMRNPDVAA